MYIADGDYIKDIEVNDLRNRYTLTKGATQKMVKLLRVLDYTSSYSSPHLSSSPPSLLFGGGTGCCTHVTSSFLPFCSDDRTKMSSVQLQMAQNPYVSCR